MDIQEQKWIENQYEPIIPVHKMLFLGESIIGVVGSGFTQFNGFQVISTPIDRYILMGSHKFTHENIDLLDWGKPIFRNSLTQLWVFLKT